MLSDLIYRLRALFFRGRLERELNDEVRFHIEQQTTKYVAAGLSKSEAARQAHIDLAGAEQAKERCRDARGVAFWESLLQDLSYSLRQFRRAPGFVAVAICVLAIGIGGNTAIFSLLNAVILRAVPVKDPQQLVVPRWTARQMPKNFSSDGFEPCSADPNVDPNACSFPYPIFRLFAARSDLFSNVTAFAGPFVVNSTASGSAERVQAEFVSGSFFQTLGVTAALGRTLRDSDDRTNAEPAVVLSYDYWQGAMNRDPRPIGKLIRLNNFPYTVVGVAQPGFNQLSPGKSTALWMPISTGARLGIDWFPSPLGDTHSFWLKIIGRVKPGISSAQIESELNRLFANEMYSSKTLLKGSDPVVHLNSAGSALVGSRNELSRPLYLLMGGVGLILLIACANVATLMTARATARQREIAIRLAIGAGRQRILRQLLTESVLLASLGGVCGVAIAYAATRGLITFLSNVRQLDLDVQPNLKLLTFTAVISVASGILFGFAPALQSAATKATGAFAGLQTAMSPTGQKLVFRHSLLVVQVALSTVMLVGSVLFIQTLHNLTTTEVGFNPRNLLLFGIDPVSSGYKPAAVPALYNEVYARLRALPSVRSVGYSSDALLNGHTSASDLVIEGRADRSRVHVNVLDVGPKFLQTLGIPLVAGRSFNAIELSRHPPVALVNQEFVRRFLPSGNPLHRRFGEKPVYEIVGVVGDAKYSSVREAVPPTVYFPLNPGTAHFGAAHFELRIVGNPTLLRAVVEKLLRQIDRNLPVFDLRTQTQQIDQTLFIEQLLTRLTTAFGVIALLLTSVGLYGLLSYEVTCRTREIGVRMAIGAQARQVQRMVLAKTALTVVTGLVIGLPCAYAATRLITSTLYGVKANDAATFAAVVLLFLMVAAIAAYLPTRRASRLDPMIALRYE